MKKWLISVIAVTTLSGCGANIDDLIAYSAEVKANTPVNIEEYPEFEALPTVEYSASNLPSPFMRTVREETASTQDLTPSCAQPNNNRRRHALESYGLDALQMSGIFTSNGRKYALVKANDGSLHKVTSGTYIGLFHGRVTQIKDSEILIKEMLPDGAGCWKSKQATLTMSSMVGENNNV
jgi:type IV pilus assembly protein PilP